MSIDTSDLLDALRARIGEYAATVALDVVATWANNCAAGAERIAAHGCNCTADHVAFADHFRHVATVLVDIYGAKPLTEDDTEEAARRGAIPQQLQNADFSHNCEGLRIWELGDEGGHVIALGHVDKQWMASAILTLSEVNHDKPIMKVMLTDIRHTTGRIEDTPGGRFDFVTRTGEGLDFKVTEWRLGSGEADTRG